EIVAGESLGLIDHYRIVRGALYRGFSAAAELADGNSLALLAGRLHENFRDCGRLTGELQRGPLLNVQNNVLVNPDYTKAIARLGGAGRGRRRKGELAAARLPSHAAETLGDPLRAALFGRWHLLFSLFVHFLLLSEPFDAARRDDDRPRRWRLIGLPHLL